MPAMSPARTAPTNGHAPLARLATIYRVLDLADDPFALDPAAGAFAPTTVHGTAHARLLDWITGRDAAGRLAIVVGETGTGKTRLLAEVAAALADDPAHHVAILPDDDALRTDAQILRGILGALGHEPAGRTGLELMRGIADALAGIRDAGRAPGILIDGADFAGPRLELTRNLLRAGEPHGLRIVLFGLPDLRDRIQRRRSLRGLLDLTLELRPLDAADCRTLIESRVAPMRRGGQRALFTDNALETVTAWAAGTAAKLVHLAGECLVEAIARGRDEVDATIAHVVARELTDQARQQARAAAASPIGEPAIQTKIPLFLDEPAPAATSAGSGERGRR